MSQRRTFGFTLVEILVVIAMIAILMAMLLPALGKVKQQTRIAATLNDIRLLDRACELYKDDSSAVTASRAYPKSYLYKDSTPTSYERVAGTASLGANVLYDALLRKPELNNGVPTGNMIVDPRKAKLYETGGLKAVQMKDSAGKAYDEFAFVDLFGNPFLYYSFDTTLNPGNNNKPWGYRPDDNQAGRYDIINPPANPVGTPSSSDDLVNWYAARDVDGSGNVSFFRKNFIIISAGPNKKWDYMGPKSSFGGSYNKSDDLTNYWPAE